jgi:hypothetical protein
VAGQVNPLTPNAIYLGTMGDAVFSTAVIASLPLTSTLTSPIGSEEVSSSSTSNIFMIVSQQQSGYDK